MICSRLSLDAIVVEHLAPCFHNITLDPVCLLEVDLADTVPLINKQGMENKNNYSMPTPTPSTIPLTIPNISSKLHQC